MELTIAAQNARCAWGSDGPLVMVFWRDITVDDLYGFSRYALGVADTHASGYGVVSMTAPKLRPPPQDVRAAILQTARDNIRPNYRGSTTIVLGDGFFASIARAALAGLSLAGGKGMPDHVSKNAAEAAGYVAPRLALDVDATAATIDAFIARVEKRA